MKSGVLFFFIMVLSFSVFAQIDERTITDSGAVCGNGVRDTFEPCDISSSADDADLCPAIGKVAGIAMVCRKELCSCLPRKYIVCGDHHTTGNEMCEADDKNHCADVSSLLGAKLECNSKSCLCSAAEDAFVKPEVNASNNASNLTQSLCGNQQVDGQEQCDPPGRQCSFEQVDGVCADDCSCKPLHSDEPVAPENNASVQPVLSEQPVVEEPLQQTETKDVVEEVDVGEESADVVSDATYTVVLIMLVVVFIVGLAFGSYFIYKKSQIGNFEPNEPEN